MTNPTINFSSGWLEHATGRVLTDLQNDGPEKRAGELGPPRIGYRTYTGGGGTTLAEEYFNPLNLSGQSSLWKLLDRLLAQVQVVSVTRAELILIHRGAKQLPMLTSSRPAAASNSNVGLLVGLNSFAAAVSKGLDPGAEWAPCLWSVLEFAP